MLAISKKTGHVEANGDRAVSGHFSSEWNGSSSIGIFRRVSHYDNFRGIAYGGNSVIPSSSGYYAFSWYDGCIRNEIS